MEVRTGPCPGSPAWRKLTEGLGQVSQISKMPYLGCGTARSILEGEFRWFLSERPGCNDILFPAAAELNHLNPSECHNAAVTVILPGLIGLVCTNRSQGGCI